MITENRREYCSFETTIYEFPTFISVEDFIVQKRRVTYLSIAGIIRTQRNSHLNWNEKWDYHYRYVSKVGLGIVEFSYLSYKSFLRSKRASRYSTSTETDKGHKLSLLGCRFHFVASKLSLPCCRVKNKGGLYFGTRTEIRAGLCGSTIAVL